MVPELLIVAALTIAPSPPVEKPKAEPLRAYARGIEMIVTDAITWPALGSPTGNYIIIRPEVRKAWRGECGARARALAHLIVAHETAHAAADIVDEDAANGWALANLEPRYRSLLPPYGSFVTTWLRLAPRCSG